MARSAGGGVLCGAPRPPTPPREDAQTGRGRRSRGPRGGGARGGAARASPTSLQPPGAGAAVSWEGDGSVSRLALCAARRRPRRRRRRPGVLCPRWAGRDREIPSWAPPPRALSGSPVAATAGPPPPRAPGPVARPGFLLAPGRRLRLAEPRGRGRKSAASRGPPGPARDTAGAAAGLGAPSFSCRCRRGLAAGAGGGGREAWCSVTGGDSRTLPAEAGTPRGRAAPAWGNSESKRTPRAALWSRPPRPLRRKESQGRREAGRLNPGPAVEPPALRHHLDPGGDSRLEGEEGQGRGRDGALKAPGRSWLPRGAHPASEGRHRRWANQGPGVDQDPGPAEQPVC